MSLAAFAREAVPGKKILVAEDDQTLREALCDTLELADYTPLGANGAEQALEILRREADIAMIVSDVNMGGMSGHELLACVKQQYPHIPMLLITAYGSVSQSVDAIRNGAVDYLVKPFESEQLIQTVAKYTGQHSSEAGDEPVAVAASSRKLLQLAQRMAQSESTVLIVGESGSGKEVLARYIHRHSPRVKQPFIAINCAAIPENMLEAMLFGHEKGAYTGAHTSAPGKFEQANGGTLLLDEISEMDLGLQAKLLRVLQEREVERLGGRKTIRLDVRVIATSNRNLQQAVLAGEFREDLYYRLSVLPLQWAPLRDRPEDIVPLASRLLARHCQKQHRVGVSLSAGAQAALLDYGWPGNVRELDNVMQRSLILQAGNIIDELDLGLEFGFGKSQSQNPAANNIRNFPLARDMENNTHAGTQPTSNPGSLSSLSAGHAANVQQDGHDELGAGTDRAALGADLKQREFEIIVKTLQQEGGSRKDTAARLGISPRTLRYKIARLMEEGLNVNAAAKGRSF